jgi:dihydroorotate dehydrogenase (NAD+) catalytic subunit
VTDPTNSATVATAPAADLRVTLGRAFGTIVLANPVMPGSGTFGKGIEFERFAPAHRFGALVPKTVTPEPRIGNPTHRVAEVPSGMLNSIGLQNPGIDRFLADDLPRYRAYGVPVIVNIAGGRISEYAALAAKFDKAAKAGGAAGPGPVVGIEINISCPNVDSSEGMAFGVDPIATYEIVRACRAETNLPIVVKFSPNVTELRPIAEAALRGGSDIWTVANTWVGVAIDWKKRETVIHRGTAGMSGPAIKPLTLKWVMSLARAFPEASIIGSGGIANVNDAMEYAVAGAKAIQVGTAAFVNPSAAVEILDGLPAALASIGCKTWTAAVGTVTSGAERAATAAHQPASR